MNLSILYRGPLSSCNYACTYCPFAKRMESPEERRDDRTALARFLGWIASRTHDTFGILFTPWGEALIRPRYQEAMIALSTMNHVRKVAIQTNLSCTLDWVERCDKTRLALWCTYHPAETSRTSFLDRCRELRSRGVPFSVGVVGLKEHRAEIAAIREELPSDVYLWVNAYKREPDYYTPDMLAELERIDPHFPINNQRHPSRGLACRTGHTVFSVSGDGTARRCHFVPEPIGNIYDPNFDACLKPRPCPSETCGCHIGYVHLEPLGLERRYGERILERIPIEYHSLFPSAR